MGEVVDADAGERRARARPAMRMAGEECRSARLDTNQWSWASAPAVREHPAVRAGRRARSAASTEHMMQRRRPARPSLLEFISFVYGNPIMRLSGGGADLARRCSALADPGVAGSPAATSLKPRPQLGRDATRCSSIDAPGRGPQRVLEHGIHLDRHARRRGPSRRVDHGAVVAERRRARRRRRPATVQSSSAFGLRARMPRAPCLGAAESATSTSPPAGCRAQCRFTSVWGLLPPACV